MKQLLKINASARYNGSVTRDLVNLLSAHLRAQNGSSTVVDRDLAKGVPQITEAMIEAFYTPKEKRTTAQNEQIAVSDELLKEIHESDVLVFGVPMYNFSVPGSLKAYFDLVARVGETFKYSENGPIGLVKGKKAYVIVASGGVEFQSEADFASNYIKLFLGFIGITDVTFIAADKLMFDDGANLEKAKGVILETTL